MADAVTEDIPINAERLYASLRELGTIGSYHDATTRLTGVRRLALTDADAEARRLVMQWMHELELEIAVDAIGNIYGRRAGRDEHAAPLMMGSHVDSVPTGGIFDGALGVLGGLEVVRTLVQHDIVTRRPIVVGVFTDEEGCRFGTDMLGSAVAAGRLELEQAHALTDADGLTVRGELQRIGFLGDEAIGQRRPHAFLECHVEQGPVLLREGVDIGVVSHVQSISWQELSIIGRAAHAGATPTAYRADAGLAAARINVLLAEMVNGGEYGELRATMGDVTFEPCTINVIPGRVIATVDLRNPNDAQMAAAEVRLQELLPELERETGVTITTRRMARTPVVPFDNGVQEVIAAAVDARGLSHRPIYAGAGHDAQEWAAVCPAGMIFVPGEHDGISHNPREHSTQQQCAHGVNVLLSAALTLAEAP